MMNDEWLLLLFFLLLFSLFLCLFFLFMYTIIFCKSCCENNIFPVARPLRIIGTIFQKGKPFSFSTRQKHEPKLINTTASGLKNYFFSIRRKTWMTIFMMIKCPLLYRMFA